MLGRQIKFVLLVVTWTSLFGIGDSLRCHQYCVGICSYQDDMDAWNKAGQKEVTCSPGEECLKGTTTANIVSIGGCDDARKCPHYENLLYPRLQEINSSFVANCTTCATDFCNDGPLVEENSTTNTPIQHDTTTTNKQEEGEAKNGGTTKTYLGILTPAWLFLFYRNLNLM